MRVSLDLHDASLLAANWEYWDRIKGRYPDFKLSLFFIPYDYYSEQSLGRIMTDEAIKRYQDNKDWIRLYPHGVTHFPNEFLHADRDATKLSLQAIDEQMKKNGLDYQRGFCAPYWLWNDEVVEVLNENNWWGAVDRNQPHMATPKRFYRYSHSIEEPFWLDKDNDWKLHGHMYLPSSNALEVCFFNLLKIPKSYEWHFIDDFIETK